jgi:hypothetical protein
MEYNDTYMEYNDTYMEYNYTYMEYNYTYNAGGGAIHNTSPLGEDQFTL